MRDDMRPYITSYLLNWDDKKHSWSEPLEDEEELLNLSQATLQSRTELLEHATCYIEVEPEDAKHLGILISVLGLLPQEEHGEFTVTLHQVRTFVESSDEEEELVSSGDEAAEADSDEDEVMTAILVSDGESVCLPATLLRYPAQCIIGVRSRPERRRSLRRKDARVLER